MKKDIVKLVIVLVELTIIIGVVIGCVMISRKVGLAEDAVSEVYALCKPGDFVNVRARPSTKSTSIGYLQAGDSFKTDGEIQNGWIHAVEMTLEEPEGWVYVGYVVTEAPEWMGGAEAEIVADGRVACRKCVGGDRISGRGGWVQPGQTVQVWYRTAEWAVTNRGYIRTEYLKFK